MFSPEQLKASVATQKTGKFSPVPRYISVLVFYPDHATGDYGGDCCFQHTAVDGAFDAAHKVQRMVSEANNGDIDPADFRPIAVFVGGVSRWR